LHTGIFVMPVAAPPGTPPRVVRSKSPFWLQRPQQKTPPAACPDPEPRRRPETAVSADAAATTRREEPPPGWDFNPGSFTYKGTDYPLSGLPLQLLQEFALAPKQTLTLEEIRHLRSPSCSEDQGYVRVSQLRQALRRLLSLTADYDPLPSTDKGTWKL